MIEHLKNGGVRATWTETVDYDVIFPPKTWKHLKSLYRQRKWDKILVWCYRNDNLEPRAIIRILENGLPKHKIQKKCDCQGQQVCDLCQRITGKEKDK